MKKFNFKIFLGVYTYTNIHLLVIYTLCALAKYAFDDISFTVPTLIMIVVIGFIMGFTNKDIK
ncbi:hypothetical protein LP092_13685 [Moraxella bovis]|uniref:Uncharacterized protein n=1 Tax=Moraxella bovis TaxID=476 RepID=A0ABY6M8B1_MORBO|nr:hypothetical protein [Moraxella bovis]UZA02967.1 hypothetical protein LP092_13685 [Moraxella bovis]